MTKKFNFPPRPRGEAMRTPSERRLTRHTLANAKRHMEEAIKTLTEALREECPHWVDNDLRHAEGALDDARLLLHLLKEARDEAPPQSHFTPGKVDRRQGYKGTRPSTRGRLKGWSWLPRMKPTKKGA